MAHSNANTLAEKSRNTFWPRAALGGQLMVIANLYAAGVSVLDWNLASASISFSNVGSWPQQEQMLAIMAIIIVFIFLAQKTASSGPGRGHAVPFRLRLPTIKAMELASGVPHFPRALSA